MIRRISSVIVGLALASAGAAWASESHSIKVTLPEATILNGKTLEPGHYRFLWTGDAPKVDVTVESGHKKLVEAQATIKEEAKPTQYDSVMSHKEKSGKQVLEEVRPGGEKMVLVFSHS